MDKYNERLKKKVSIGLSLELSLEEYEKIFDNYGEYLHSLYFSPPLDGKYHSRTKITTQLQNPRNKKKLFDILELAKENDILLDCVLNRPTIRLCDVEQAIPFIETMKVDQITCLQEHVDLIDKYFPDKDLIFSYNNDLNPRDINNISKKFGTVVVAKSFLRTPELLRKIATNGFKLKPLVNNGCSYNCQGCKTGNIECQNTFDKNLEKYGLNYLYALQSFYPFELEELLNIIEEEKIPLESIKISNRTDGYSYLNKCLDSYINGTNPQKYIDEHPQNYRLWSRLGALNDHLFELDSEEIIKIKEKGFKKHV